MGRRIYFEEATTKIILSDSLTTRQIPDSSIDLIVTSPQYNLDISYKLTNDGMPYDEYLKFTKRWLKRCLAMVKDDGRLCLNIPLDKNKGGHQIVGADITKIAKEVG